MRGLRFNAAAALTVTALSCAIGGVLAAKRTYARYLASDAPPCPPGLPVHSTLFDLRPLEVTITAGWQLTTVETTVDGLPRNGFLLRNMLFSDWDRLSPDIRQPALARMRVQYEPILANPAAWAGMDAADWDTVPQPVRLVVFPMMVDYWVREEAIGSRFGLDEQLVSRTVGAIVMAESWFEHRAFYENAWGNQDIGLGQCSNRCRHELARMSAAGKLDFTFSDEDYFNPWHASRAAAVWFALELGRSGGDLEMAIRAYHRGAERARRGEGAAYLENVLGVRRRYFAGAPNSPTWRAMHAWGQTGGTVLSALADTGDGPGRVGVVALD